MAIIMKNFQDGEAATLNDFGSLLGVGVTSLGREFEVAGVLISRLSPEPGGPAFLVAAEEGGRGSLHTNAAYNPANPGRGWRRTINFLDGNVGIGGSNDSAATAPSERLVVAGNILATGDVRLEGSDCAEEFDVDDLSALEPGTVLVIGDDERLCQCNEPYDTKVAGVVSGTGKCRPGIILGRGASSERRLPIALAGKVYCKVDAQYAPIGVGDLITTSATPGHGMKLSDPSGAIGAVLGKALRGLREGKGLIPILVALQ